MNTTTEAQRTNRHFQPYYRKFVRNAWYVAGWSEDITDNLLSRRILDEPVVMYRREDGKPVALSDICPHKLAPMHLGTRVGSNIRCGYHGLEFNSDGTCVANPQGNQKVPSKARLKSYPFKERYGALWIWMGDPERAEQHDIPDFSHITGKDQQAVKGGHLVKCNYMMMIENLMDLGHAMFLHGQTAGVQPEEIEDSEVLDMPDGGVLDKRTYRKVLPPRAFAPYLPESDAAPDMWTDIRWTPPSLILNYTGCAQREHIRSDNGVYLLGTHFLTPETQHTTHYFYAHVRNYALNDPAADEGWRQWQEKALKAEDSMIAEAIDGYLEDAQRLEVEVTLLSTDVSGAKVNQKLNKLVDAEEALA